jgi:cytochrome c-type biogenesis protein CcmH/NrfG
MATKKQQRRRQKQKRHDYEEVYVDDEGNELDPDEAEELVGPTARKSERAKTKQPVSARERRALEPPSWRRALRRGLIFFPLMLLVIFLLSPELTTVQKVINTLVLMAFFIPFSYFMDSIMWRSVQRRLAKQGEKKS